MKITAQDLLKFGIIDGIVPEPVGGAHREPDVAIRSAGDAIATALSRLSSLSPKALRAAREDKFLGIGRRI
jgi:acetyl-CoA carboxylase carboxyl transferase subunit alpha